MTVVSEEAAPAAVALAAALVVLALAAASQEAEVWCRASLEGTCWAQVSLVPAVLACWPCQPLLRMAVMVQENAGAEKITSLHKKLHQRYDQ